MSVSTSAFITELNARVDNSVATSTKVSWVNTIENGVYEDINRETVVQYYNKQNGVYQYTLPTGCLWEDVHGVFVDSKPYRKKSVLHNFDNYSYYYDQSKLNIYPVPTEDDVSYTSKTSEVTFKAISYTSNASELTFAHNTITTTGTAFTASSFQIGMTIWITGCIDTGNNKTAVITGVAASVLTFADYTFDDDTTADTGVINLATNGIYTSGAHFTGFEAEAYALVSGCLLNTANNKYARIFAVADHYLTFALGTFAAQAETAAITVKQPSIAMVYKYRRTAKTEANILTEYLLLPDRFIEMYYQYCIAQIYLYNNEFEIYNNWMGFYNASVNDYKEWYGENKEQNVAHIADTAWGNYTNEETEDEDD
ncbi:MAG: hypothetical protein WC554_07185 [Clostridia bacterium]